MVSGSKKLKDFRDEKLIETLDKRNKIRINMYHDQYGQVCSCHIYNKFKSTFPKKHNEFFQNDEDKTDWKTQKTQTCCLLIKSKDNANSTLSQYESLLIGDMK